MKRLNFLLILTTFFSHRYISQCALSCLPEGAIYEVTPLYYQLGQTTFTTLAGKIPELSDLGVKTIYLMPVFKASGIGPSATDAVRFSNAYNVQDYYQLDSHYGTNNDMKDLIDTAHAHGIRVLFDLVLNHTYYPSVFMDSAWDYRITPQRLADTSATLGYPIKYDTIGGRIFPYVNKQYAGGDSAYSFRGWKDVNNVIHVMHYPTWRWWFGIDYSNTSLIRYIVNLSKYFINQYDFDGWRLDAPSNNRNPYLFSGTHNMASLLNTVKDSMIAIKPSCVLISENPASARTPNPLNDFDQMVEASYDDSYIANTWATTGVINDPMYVVPNLVTQLNSENILYNRSRIRFSENHDNPRIAKRNPNLNKPLLIFNSTISPNIPMIQAGQEIGDTGYINSIPSGMYNPSQIAMRNFYRKVLRTRNAYNSLKYGTIQNILVNTTTTLTSKSYSYLRTFNGEMTIAMVNFTSDTIVNTLNVPYSSGTLLHDSLSAQSFTVNNPSSLQVTLLPYSGRILVPDNPSGIKEFSSKEGILSAFPNPFFTDLILQSTVPLNNVTMELYNSSGQLVKQIKNISGQSFRLHRDNLISGLYILKVTKESKLLEVKKLCLN